MVSQPVAMKLDKLTGQLFRRLVAILAIVHDCGTFSCAVFLLQRVCFLHAGYVHMDVAQRNLLERSNVDGGLILIDFGAARKVGEVVKRAGGAVTTAANDVLRARIDDQPIAVRAEFDLESALKTYALACGLLRHADGDERALRDGELLRTQLPREVFEFPSSTTFADLPARATAYEKWCNDAISAVRHKMSSATSTSPVRPPQQTTTTPTTTTTTTTTTATTATTTTKTNNHDDDNND